ncbi:hypothetical protein AB0G15_25020, partial [Streptosporangium sp. NPDC023825]
LAASEAAVLARVEALERYAGHVADAERALRAHDQIEALRARLPRYEELLAESGADAFAVPEIGRLAEDAGHLEQALRDSVRSAHEAFRHLDGPAATSPGGPGSFASGFSASSGRPPGRGDGSPAPSPRGPADPSGEPPSPANPSSPGDAEESPGR